MRLRPRQATAGDADRARLAQRAAAREDARRLVLQLTGREPLHCLDHYQFGLALRSGEVAYRSGWADWRLRTDYLHPITINGVTSTVRWPDPTSVFCLITSDQVAYRNTAGQLTQIYWSALAGVTVDLHHEQLLLDYDDGRAGLFTGATVAQLAVVAVDRLYGELALLEHPALAPLRAAAH